VFLVILVSLIRNHHSHVFRSDSKTKLPEDGISGQQNASE